MRNLKGKTIIVTGAANGIGRAEAELLCQSGANVVFTDIDEVNGIAAAQPFGKNGIFVKHDVSLAANWEKVIT